MGMKLLRRLFSPLTAFIGIQIVWIIVLIFWIDWFINRHHELRRLTSRISPNLATGDVDWFILTEGILLLVAILIGVYVIFLFWRRQAALYRTQRDLIAQVTHELKSPLASIQLHLETLQRHKVSPEKTDHFVETMLGDTARLRGLIDNLLMANRLERRGIRLVMRPTDLSVFVREYFESRDDIASNLALELDITPGLTVEADTEVLETALRNLLENALLYGGKDPYIRIELHREGRFAHLVLRDRGRGINKKDLKKIFRLFYRARWEGSKSRGTGLGLFIVRSIIKRHRGRIWAESAGPHQGSAFHIMIPLSYARPRSTS